MEIKITEILPAETLDLRHRVMWPDKPKSYVELVEDPNGIHLGLWKDAVLITVVSLFIENQEAQFRKLATEVSEQGNGYASQLIEHLMQVAAGKGIQLLWCNARIEKAAFYERLGMRQTSKRFSKGGKEYIIMQKIIAP